MLGHVEAMLSDVEAMLSDVEAMFSAFLLLCLFALLLFYFSSSLASLFSASLLFGLMFFLLRCFSAFLVLLALFLKSCVFVIFPIRTNHSHMSCFLYQGLELELTSVSICNKQIPNLTNSHIYGKSA